MPTGSDTIAAIATSYGRASIGVIRLSGPAALKVTESIWRGKKLEPHQLTLGWIVEKQEKIDQAMVVYMPAPHSYTGEDIVEIQLHGSPIILNRVLDLATAKEARLAQPGEFTKRAYLNSKLDFTQAEAVADIITAEHEALTKLSADQLAGGITNKTKTIKMSLARLAASLTAQLDFSEEEATDMGYSDLAKKTAAISQELNIITSTGESIVHIKNGIKIALIGLPNAGKSTLLNKLIGYERAIVTDIAGTTRDSIEESIVIDGLNFRLVDTAGLNFEPETIEQIGIERTIRELKNAHLVLLLIEPDKEEQTLAYLKHNKLSEALTKNNTIIVLTKSDLKEVGLKTKSYDSIHISASDISSITALKKMMREKTVGKNTLENATISTKRQLSCVKKANTHIAAALRAINSKQPFDVILVDIEEALSSLNELTGEHTSSQIIDELFAGFCIGK